MNLKKLTKQISFLTLASILCLTLTNTNNIHAMVSDADDEFDFLLSGFTDEDLSTLRTCDPTEAAKWNSLLSIAIDGTTIPQLLDSEFYRKTSIPRTRNILNYPNFQLCSYQDMDSQRQFTFHIFYNQSSKKHYTKSADGTDGTKIGSYINICNRTFLSLLESASRSSSLPPELAPIKDLNFPLVFQNLFNARLEERRVGALAHYYQQINDKTYFEAKLPLLWMIKNLNFTDKEKDTFRQQFSSFQGSGFDEDAFARSHLIFDAIGTGTMELSLCTKFWERDYKSLDGGVFLLLPTDFQFARGLYGTYFEPKDQQPILDLCDLVNLQDISNPIKSPDFNTILYNYFINALDHLSSALLQCPLGYDKHVGIGFKLSPYWKIKENLEFNSLYTLEILLPQEQKRFFVPKDTTLFSEAYAAMPATTDAENNAKLLFLEQRLTTTLFPRVFTTKVFPGIVFTSTSNLQKSYKNWNFTGGYNGWFITKEKFLSVKAPSAQEAAIIYDFEKSKASDAYMIKLYGKVHRLFHTRRHHDISWSLWADATVFNNTVGNDFSFGMSFDTKF